jgi:hypothetical protein
MNNEPLRLTRREIEERLEKGLVGKLVSFVTIRDETITGKLQRLAVNVVGNELMVSFMVNHTRYEVDLIYFTDNITIHVNPNGTDSRDVRRILKGD